jgi:hypothetical protein
VRDLGGLLEVLARRLELQRPHLDDAEVHQREGA